jgi:hypothetical protein
VEECLFAVAFTLGTGATVSIVSIKKRNLITPKDVGEGWPE